MSNIRRIISFLQIPKAILNIILLELSPVKVVIEKNMDRWFQETGYPEQPWLWLPNWRGLLWFLWKCPAFRNLFYYRIVHEEGIASRIFLELAKLLYWLMNTLYFYTPKIGPGLFIQHSFCTIISAKSIGKNCWINQQVTIGYSNFTYTPTIGNGVSIMTDAKVFGNIIIGDNSIIAANAVVFKNIPSDCTVVEAPANIVKSNGKKVRSQL